MDKNNYQILQMSYDNKYTCSSNRKHVNNYTKNKNCECFESPFDKRRYGYSENKTEGFVYLIQVKWDSGTYRYLYNIQKWMLQNYKTTKANYIPTIITKSNNSPKALRRILNIDSWNNTLASNMCLQVGNKIVSNPGTICNTFNKTFTETVNKLVLDNYSIYTQTSNNIKSLKDWFVLLEIAESDLIKVIHCMKNKISAVLAGSHLTF
jgi:hypothetical protein